MTMQSAIIKAKRCSAAATYGTSSRQLCATNGRSFPCFGREQIGSGAEPSSSVYTLSADDTDSSLIRGREPSWRKRVLTIEHCSTTLATNLRLGAIETALLNAQRAMLHARRLSKALRAWSCFANHLALAKIGRNTAGPRLPPMQQVRQRLIAMPAGIAGDHHMNLPSTIIRAPVLHTLIPLILPLGLMKHGAKSSITALPRIAAGIHDPGHAVPHSLASQVRTDLGKDRRRLVHGCPVVHSLLCERTRQVEPMKEVDAVHPFQLNRRTTCGFAAHRMHRLDQSGRSCSRRHLIHLREKFIVLDTPAMHFETCRSQTMLRRFVDGSRLKLMLGSQRSVTKDSDQ